MRTPAGSAHGDRATSQYHRYPSGAARRTTKRREFEMPTARIKLSAAVLAAAAVATVGGTAAAGASDAARAPQRFTVYSANIANKDAPLLVQATGRIAGIGTATAKEDRAGDRVPLTFKLPRGKLFVTAHDKFAWKPDLTTCTATGRATGRYKITGGTRAYRGATGHGTFVEKGAAIGVRGAHGRCLQQFKVNYVIAKLTGA
jgi:hypothetical protein